MRTLDGEGLLITKKFRLHKADGIFYGVLTFYSLAGTWMTPMGHSFTHSWQPTHLSWSMWARLFSTVMASLGQALAHFMQPMQPAVQALREAPPLC